MAGGQGELPLASGVGPFASRSSNASVIAGLYGCVVYGEGLRQSRRNSLLLNFGQSSWRSTWQAGSPPYWMWGRVGSL